MKRVESALLHIILLVMFAVFSMAGTVAADEETANNPELSAKIQSAERLVGAWTVSLTNTNTRAANPALYSFLPGGVLNQSENPMVDPMLGNLVFSNAHGAWEYDAEKDQYLIRYFKLVFQADAAYWGQEETVGTLKLDKAGEKLVGVISFGNDKAEFSGTRIIATDK